MSVSLNGKIQQLCCLGLDSHVVVGELTKLVRDLIPSYGLAWMWLDEHGEIDHIYSDHIEAYEKMALYSNYVAHRGKMNDYRRLASPIKLDTPQQYGRLFGSNSATVHKHFVLNEIILPLKIQSGLMAPIGLDNGALGVAHVFRDSSSNAYQTKHQLALGRVARHINYGFKKGKLISEFTSDAPINTAFVRVSKNLEFLGHSDQALQLIYLMADDFSTNPLDLPRRLFKKLAGKLHLVDNELMDEAPTITIQNRWGRFDVAAFSMQAAKETTVEGEVVIRIEHLVPSEFLFFKKLDSAELTTRQREVCILIARNLSYRRIAASLGVAKSTVVSHKKEIFSRLGIDNRAQLNTRIHQTSLV